MQSCFTSESPAWWRSILIVLLFLCVVPSAWSLNPERSLDQYTRQSWSLDDGLPQATVTAIVQGQDQYLYIATFGGLLRFDGIRFTPIPDQGGCGNRFGSLAVDEHGVLWAGVSRGGLCRVVWRQNRQVLVPFEASNNVSINGIISLMARPGGGVWAATVNGLFEVDAESVTYYGQSAGLPDLELTDLFAGSNDELWLLSDTRVCKFANGRCVVPEWFDSVGAGRFSSGIKTSTGEIWLGRESDLFRIRSGRVEQIDLPDGLGTIAKLLEDSRGNLWVASTLAGLKRLYPKIELVSQVSEPIRNARALFEDREQNIWVGYSGDGLERLSDGKAYGVHLPDAAASLDVMAVENDPNGGLWITVPCTGLARVDGERIDITETKPSIGTGCIWSLLSEPDGRLWLGTFGEGLVLRTRAGELIKLDGPPTHERLVRALAKDPVTGDLLVGSDQGVYRYRKRQNGQPRDFLPRDFLLVEGTEDLDVHFITTDADGTIWVGSRTGAMRISADGIKRYRRADGLIDEYVRAIKIDPDGVVWLGTYGGGLYRLEGEQMVHYGPENGLPDDIVSRIIEDEDQNFWMTGNRGVVRVEREQLEAYANGDIDQIKARLFNARDGMPISETNGGGQPAGLLRENGELWIPTIDGMAVFDTRTPDRPMNSPPVVIERIVLDGQALSPDQPIDLPSTARNLEIHYTAPAFKAPERVRFRYRLEGFDTRWTEAGNRRVAYFPIIPPGELTFRVTAARGTGDWNQDHAELSIRMQPRFTQTALFLPLLILTVAGLVGLFFIVRVSSLRAREKALKLEVKKRTIELERLAAIDALTGVANRRAFDQRLKREWARHQRTATSLSVLIVDVDHFKKYNDHYGHQAGDECLQVVAKTLNEVLRREIELLARIGGEEFGIILAETESNIAEDTAEHLRQAVEALALPHAGLGDDDIVTVSIGVASMKPSKDKLRASLFRAADDSLYKAKRQGRNRVVSA